LIHLLAQPNGMAARVRQILASPGNHKREALLPLLAESGAVEIARRKAQDFALRARSELQVLPSSPCRYILEKLTEQVIHRDH
jgi:octaprenyl-diphosphate synthase